MINYNWDWSVITKNTNAFLQGIAKTFELTFLSITIGTILGVGIGILLASRKRQVQELKLIVLFLVNCIKSLPILILLLLFNFWLPPLIGIHSAFLLSVIAVSLNLASFFGDVLCSAITGVPNSYIKAGFAIGMNERHVLRRIILPSAFSHILPTIALLYIDILKMSSIASVISVKEITYMSSLVSSTSYKYLEVFAFLSFVYLIIVLPFTYGVRRLEKSKWFLKRI